MGLELKADHNLRPLLTKTKKNKLFHPMMDLLSTSSLSFALCVNPQIYINTLREFWANATIITHNYKPVSLSSSIQSKPVSITPEILNTHLQLQDDDDDATCALSFNKAAMQSAFVDVGYAGKLSIETLWKGDLPPPYRYLLHTLMVCFSKKSGSFDQASIHIQELFYSLIKNQKYNVSHYIFNDLIANYNDKLNKFLMYPRLLSFVLSKLLDQDIIAQGNGDYVKAQTTRVFTSMAKDTICNVSVDETQTVQTKDVVDDSSHEPIAVTTNISSGGSEEVMRAVQAMLDSKLNEVVAMHESKLNEVIRVVSDLRKQIAQLSGVAETNDDAENEIIDR